MSRAMLKLRFGLNARIGLYERVCAFLENNIDIVSTLTSIRDRYKKGKDFKYKILNEWIAVMNQGGKFADAIQPWVPAAEHMLISAGEKGQGLIAGLKEATVLSSASSKNKKAIIGGLATPVFLTVMILMMLAGFQLKMVPIFSGLLPVEQWPSNASILNTISAAIVDYWYVFLFGVLIVGFIVTSTIGSWTGSVRNKFDKLPPWSFYKTFQASSFLIALSSLMKAGVPNYDALKMMHRNASPWMKIHLNKMMASMRLSGTNPGEALDTGLLDPATAGDVQDYSKLSSFQDAIYILGKRSIEDGVERTNNKMAVLRNLMFFLVAISIGTVYSTVYTLQSEIGDRVQSGMNH